MVRLVMVAVLVLAGAASMPGGGTGVEAARPREGLHRRRAMAARDRGAARGGGRCEGAETRRGALLARAQPEPVRRPGLGRRDDWPARARLSVEHVGQAGAIAADRDRRAFASQRRLVVDGASAAAAVRRARADPVARAPRRQSCRLAAAATAAEPPPPPPSSGTRTSSTRTSRSADSGAWRPDEDRCREGRPDSRPDRLREREPGPGEPGRVHAGAVVAARRRAPRSCAWR